VGVDCWNYAPVSLDELKEYFKNKKVELPSETHNESEKDEP